MGIGQQGRQSASTTGDAGPHGTGRDVEHFADLGVVHTQLLTQDDHDPELVRELRQRRVDGEPIDHAVIGTTVIGRGPLELGKAGVGAAGPPTELVEAGIGGDPVRPGTETGPTVEAIEPPDDRQQRLLCGVGGVGIVSGEAPADPVDAGIVGAQ